MADEQFEPEVVKNANYLLHFLITKAEEDVDTVMKTELDDQEYERNRAKLNKIISEEGLPKAVGAVRAGTGIVKEEADLQGEPAQQAIRALKASNRILQCGRGRGKCIVVVKDTDIPLLQVEENPAIGEWAEDQNDAEDVQDNAVDTVAIDNIPVMLRHVRDAYRSMERQNKELARERNKLKKELEEKNEKISELEAKAQNQTMATWQ